MTRLIHSCILFGAALVEQFLTARAVRDSHIELFDALSADVEANGVGSKCTTSESTEWLNTLLGGLWPHINAMVQGIITDSVVPAIKEAIPNDGFIDIEKLLNFKFEQSSLGTQPPRLGNFVMCPMDDGWKLTAALTFKSNSDFAVSTSLIGFGLHDLSITGKVAIHFGQFIDEAPLVGGLTVHFVDPPEIDWELEGAGDFPWVDGIVHGAVDSAIAGLLVMPNQIVVPLGREDQGVDLSELKRPPPVGFLQVAPVKATNLEMSDRTITGARAAPDPFVTLKLGDQTWKSSMKNNNVNPTWHREGAIFTVWDRGQSLGAGVFDHDTFSGDDLLGRSSITVKMALAQQALLGRKSALSLKTKKGEANGASLSLVYQWLCMVPGKLSKMLPSILRVELHKVVVPAGQEHEVQVIMTAEQKKTATAFYKDVLRSHKTDPISTNVIRNLMKMEKISKEDIMLITSLDEAVVDETMSTINANEDRAGQGEIDIHSTLYMPFFPDDIGAAEGVAAKTVKLEVKTKTASLGSFRFSLQQIPEASVRSNGEPRYTPMLLKINKGSGSQVVLHVSMNLLATDSHSCAEL